MKKLIIDVYAVTDQKVYDDDHIVKPLQEVFNLLVDQFNESFMKNNVQLHLIDVLKDEYDEELASENLSENILLPWTYFNKELEFYNGFSRKMIFQEAKNQMSYRIVKR